MSNIIVIVWMPWDWKTTLSFALRDYYTENNISHEIIHSDVLYMKFMREKYRHLVWEFTEMSMQWHYWSLSKIIQEEYNEYVMSEIIKGTDKDNIVVEWWQLTHFLREINKRFALNHDITNVLMDKGWITIMKWKKVPRDRDIYKHVLSID